MTYHPNQAFYYLHFVVHSFLSWVLRLIISPYLYLYAFLFPSCHDQDFISKECGQIFYAHMLLVWVLTFNLSSVSKVSLVLLLLPLLTSISASSSTSLFLHSPTPTPAYPKNNSVFLLSTFDKNPFTPIYFNCASFQTAYFSPC